MSTPGLVKYDATLAADMEQVFNKLREGLEAIRDHIEHSDLSNINPFPAPEEATHEQEARS